VFVPCTDGIRAVDIGNGSFQVRWHATTNATGPAVVGGGAVWSVGIQDGVLYALDPDTGATITSLTVGPVHHFATPTLSGGEVFVPVADGILAVSGA
jgi:polyvinyl alcohol dehydrogenase (cytochrome)